MTDDDYHYLGPGDIVDPPRASRAHGGVEYAFPATSRNTTRVDSANPLAPDILILKHRGTTYPLHFSAFSIGEGVLRVGELRKLAAKETGTSDPRRVKLLYKGKSLKDDAVACREEGLKQNSELMCVISTEPVINGRADDSSESADEEEMLRDLGGPRVDVDGTLIGGRDEPPRKRKGHRSKKKRQGGREESPARGGSARDSGYLVPDSGYGIGAAPTSRSSSPMRPKAAAPSQQLPTSPAMDKLEEISSAFHTKFVPQCIQFTSNPPTDTKARDYEYKKLSESILQQIVLKLDAVETEGNEGVRARRKEIVKETQDMLNKLDATMKR